MPFIKHIKPQEKVCWSPEHTLPTMIVMPAGYHEYQCPACGKITSVNIPEFTCKV